MKIVLKFGISKKFLFAVVSICKSQVQLTLKMKKYFATFLTVIDLLLFNFLLCFSERIDDKQSPLSCHAISAGKNCGFCTFREIIAKEKREGGVKALCFAYHGRSLHMSDVAAKIAINVTCNAGIFGLSTFSINFCFGITV